MSECFPEPKAFIRIVKVDLDLSNYATKLDLKNATGVDRSKFAKKVDLASLKSNEDKQDIDELKNVPTNLSNMKSKLDKLDVDKSVPAPVQLSKLSDVVKNDVVQKDLHNAKMKNIEDKIRVTNLATNTTLNTKINEVKGEILSITNLVTNDSLNTKTSEVKNKIPNFTNKDTTTTTTLTVVESFIPTVTNLLNATD